MGDTGYTNTYQITNVDGQITYEGDIIEGDNIIIDGQSLIDWLEEHAGGGGGGGHVLVDPNTFEPATQRPNLVVIGATLSDVPPTEGFPPPLDTEGATILSIGGSGPRLFQYPNSGTGPLTVLDNLQTGVGNARYGVRDAMMFLNDLDPTQPFGIQVALYIQIELGGSFVGSHVGDLPAYHNVVTDDGNRHIPILPGGGGDDSGSGVLPPGGTSQTHFAARVPVIAGGDTTFADLWIEGDEVHVSGDLPSSCDIHAQLFFSTRE